MNNILNRARMIVFVSFVTLCAPLRAQESPASPEQQDHQALRTLLQQAAEAMNKRDMKALGELVDAGDFSVTTVDNQRFKSFADFQTGYLALFEGPKASVEQLTMNPVADELTTFLSPTIGVCHGSSKDTYKFKDGDERTMTTRWTAVLKKTGGSWRISRLHFSAALLDNPALAAATEMLTKFSVGAGLLGLALGSIAGRALRRNRS